MIHSLVRFTADLYFKPKFKFRKGAWVKYPDAKLVAKIESYVWDATMMDYEVSFVWEDGKKGTSWSKDLVKGESPKKPAAKKPAAEKKAAAKSEGADQDG